MNRVRNQTDKVRRPSRGWKRVALAAVAVALLFGLTGCTDILNAFGPTDIPFEQENTKPTDMGAVDNQPTVPIENGFDDLDLRPF